MAQTHRQPVVVIGLLGTTLDLGKHPDRWQNWRPSVAICRQPDLIVDRFELLHAKREQALAETVKADIASVSPETEVVLQRIEFTDPWDFEQVYEKLFSFARSYPFDSEAEDYLVHITTGTHVAQICLFLLTESRHLPGKLLQSSPDRDRGGAGSVKIIDLDLSKYDRIASRFHQEQQEGASFLKGGIETRNPGFNRLIDRIEKVASSTRDPLLLTGPTGAGKSRLAKRIFELKKTRHAVAGAFVEVNCATIRGDGAMSALFGHVRGAFTGAESERAGLLRTANSGVLFLDEIGELGLDEQAMLLRAIEEKVFFPLGSDREVESDFQLIAGTNRDLLRSVRSGHFREDLLARINLWTFQMPGLAERREDIEPNLEFELDQYERRTGDRIAFNKEARTRFLQFAHSAEALWQGNFRDLNAAVIRMATLSAGGRISVEIVEDEIKTLQMSWSGAPAADLVDPLRSLLSSDRLAALDLFDRVQLSRVVEVCRRAQSLSDAGRQLFGVSRTQRVTANDADRLRKYLARFGLNWVQIVRSNDPFER